MKLVHHPLDGQPGARSPFAAEIFDIARDGYVRIACPYLGLRAFESLVDEALDFRLLTDAEALLESQFPSTRENVFEFLIENERRVRHYPGLHAKVVIGERAALVGSANLTDAGMCLRQEMAVRIDEPSLRRELERWFDGLWELSSTPSLEELDRFISHLPSEPRIPHRARIPSSAPRVRAVLIEEPPASSSIDSATSSGIDDETRLRERLAYVIRHSSREWVEGYLDWCGDLLDSLQIVDDDPRLTMSVPRSNRSLPVTLNQRYVLSAFFRGRKVISMMLPRGFDEIAGPRPFRAGSFDQWRDEEAGDVPMLCYFRVEHPDELLPYREAWLTAVTRELGRRWSRSSFRKHHVSALHRAALDRSFRTRLLDEVDSNAVNARRAPRR